MMSANTRPSSVNVDLECSGRDLLHLCWCWRSEVEQVQTQAAEPGLHYNAFSSMVYHLIIYARMYDPSGPWL